MTNEEFKAWRKRLDLTQAAAGRALGKNRRTIAAYEGAANWRGNRIEIPLAVEKACKWIEFGEWRDIGTAPDDGSEIKLRIAENGDECIGHWWADGNSWVDKDGKSGGEKHHVVITGVWLVDDGWLEPSEVDGWKPEGK